MHVPPLFSTFPPILSSIFYVFFLSDSPLPLNPLFAEAARRRKSKDITADRDKSPTSLPHQYCEVEYGHGIDLPVSQPTKLNGNIQKSTILEDMEDSYDDVRVRERNYENIESGPIMPPRCASLSIVPDRYHELRHHQYHPNGKMVPASRARSQTVVSTKPRYEPDSSKSIGRIKPHFSSNQVIPSANSQTSDQVTAWYLASNQSIASGRGSGHILHVSPQHPAPTVAATSAVNPSASLPATFTGVYSKTNSLPNSQPPPGPHHGQLARPPSFLSVSEQSNVNSGDNYHRPLRISRSNPNRGSRSSIKSNSRRSNSFRLSIAEVDDNSPSTDV